MYTQPSGIDGYDPKEYGYIAASYVKYLEMAGGRVVPIPYDADQATLDKLFDGLNGLFFPGGGADLTRKSKFGSNAEYLFKKAVKANDAGIYFPIWGTCLGFELIHVIAADFADDVLTSIQDESAVTRSLNFTQYASRMFAGLPLHLKMYSLYDTPYYYNHQWCVRDRTYTQYPALDKFFHRIAHSQNQKGDQFLAAVEGKKYPFYGTQFHPEKNNFEFRVHSDHGKQACEITQFLANFFLNEARKNNQMFKQIDLDALLIWNTNPIQPPSSSSFEQVYMFKNSKVSNDITEFLNYRHD